MILNIITPSFQPENLKLLEKSIVAAARDLPIEVNWFIYYPISKTHIPIVEPHPRLKVVQQGFCATDPEQIPVPSRANMLNWCLDDIEAGFVYVLSDDTLMHPQLISELISQKQKDPKMQLMVTGQHLEDDTIQEPTITPGAMSFSQYVADRTAIADLRYTEEFQQDGIFVYRLHQKCADTTVIVKKPLSYVRKIEQLRLINNAPENFDIGSVVTIDEDNFHKIYTKLQAVDQETTLLQRATTRLRRQIGKKALISNIIEDDGVYLVNILPLRKSHIAWRKGEGTIIKFPNKQYALNIFKLIEKITPDAL